MSITDELREYAHDCCARVDDAIHAIADRIDAEHERAVMSAMNDALKPIDPSAKREPIQAILECSAPDTPVRRVIVSDEETDCATGFCTCGSCGEPIDPWDSWCRHCGAELEDE